MGMDVLFGKTGANLPQRKVVRLFQYSEGRLRLMEDGTLQFRPIEEIRSIRRVLAREDALLLEPGKGI